MEERRQYPRRPLMFYARIYDRKSGKLLGHLADITPAGFLLVGDEQLPERQPFSLQLELPEGFSFQDVFLKFEATSIWSQPDLEPSLWASGFHLADVSQHARQVIEQIIESYGLDSARSVQSPRTP